MLARVHKDESGYSLTELLVAMTVGLIVLFAAFLLLDTANSTSAQHRDRQDAVQRGRAAMELLTRQVRSQVCLGAAVQPITYGDPNTVTFYADLTDGSKNVERRKITFDATAKTITEYVYPGTGVYPDLTFPVAPAQTRVLLTKVERATNGGTPIAFLRYYAFDAAGAPGALRQLPTPLSAANAPLVVMVKIAYKALPGHEEPARPRFDQLLQRRLRPPRQPDCSDDRTEMSLKLRCQKGFTTVTLMGVLGVGGILVAAGFAAVDADISLSREDQDYKQSHGAAEAGLQWYLNRLGQDNNFYVRCTNVPDPNGTEQAPVNLKWNGIGRRPAAVAQAAGQHREGRVHRRAHARRPGTRNCVENNQYSMVDTNGNLTVRVTGRSRGEYRSVLATLRRSNFIDFIYFTDFETLDPAAYPTAAETVTAASSARVRAAAGPRRRLHRDPVRVHRRDPGPLPHERQRA